MTAGPPSRTSVLGLAGSSMTSCGGSTPSLAGVLPLSDAVDWAWRADGRAVAVASSKHFNNGMNSPWRPRAKRVDRISGQPLSINADFTSGRRSVQSGGRDTLLGEAD